MNGDIMARIDSGYGALSPQEQRAADFILDHLADLAVFSATEIAQGSGVSKATVSRLFRRLGFADAQEVRDQARASRRRGVPVGSVGDSSTHLEAERDNLETMLRGLADGRLERAVSLIARARQVVVIGFRNSYPVALHLRQQLAQARDGVRLVPQPGQSVAEEIVGLSSDDVVVLLGFRRRPAGFDSLVKAVSSRRIPMVLISETAPLGDAASTVRLVAPIDNPSPFDSYAAPMSLAGLLASGVLATNPQSSRARIADITGLYGSLGELEGHRPE
ncbi:MAG: hypothetical protein JWP75_1138 [Frondihabitans sp.]|nr:hypothetical protein [Frondihabitans sp.]